MRIGLDIDDTICDTHQVLIKYANKYSKEVLHKELSRYDSNNFMEVLDCSFGEMVRYYDMYYTIALKEIMPKYYAKEVLEELIKEGHEIVFITIRNDKECKGSAKEITEEWLAKYEIPYNELYTEIFDKKKCCQENNIDVFVDDSEKNCIQVSELGIKTYLANAIFNLNFEDKNIERVENMLELKEKINEIKR